MVEGAPDDFELNLTTVLAKMGRRNFYPLFSISIVEDDRNENETSVNETKYMITIGRPTSMMFKPDFYVNDSLTDLQEGVKQYDYEMAALFAEDYGNAVNESALRSAAEAVFDFEARLSSMLYNRTADDNDLANSTETNIGYYKLSELSDILPTRYLVVNATELPRWAWCLSEVKTEMNKATNAMFVRRNLDKDAVRAVRSIMSEMLETLQEKLTKNDWMDETARNETIAKARNMTMRISHDISEEELDKHHEELTFSSDDSFAEMLCNTKTWKSYKEYSKLIGQVDELADVPDTYTVDGAYSPEKNLILLPAALLRPGMFHPTYPMALKLGKLGFILGHEIMHGYDNDRIYTDWSGNNRDLNPEMFGKVR